MNIAVIIPYYQKSAGILARCLRSVFGQKLADGYTLDVIVVDDSSPFAPASDVEAAGATPAGISVRIIRRVNGGPGAARNTGLNAVAADCAFVAFLDSDDEWTPDHLARAMLALGDDADFYFANHQRGDGGATDLDQSRFLQAMRTTSQRRNVAGVEVIERSGLEIADFIVDEYLAHTSSIVFRADRLRTVRYEEALRSAGEDHLFSLDLALGSRQVCVSLASEVVRGTGVSIYESALEWGSGADLRRRVFNIAGLKFMRARAVWPAATRQRMRRRLHAMRAAVGYLLVTQPVRGGKDAKAGLALAAKLDPIVIGLAPYFAAAFLADRRLRKV